jgi:hypothetical protein
MKFKKILFLLIFSLFLVDSIKPKKTEILAEQKSEVFNLFNDLMSYKFSNSEYKKFQIISFNQLSALLEKHNYSFLDQLLESWRFVEYQMFVWQATVCVNNKFSELTYRRAQQARIQVLFNLFNFSEKQLSSKRVLVKVVKNAVDKKAFAVMKKHLNIKAEELFLYKDYFLFIEELVKNESNFNFILDEEKLDKLIFYFKDLSLKNKTAKLFLENLLEIKIRFLQKQDLQESLDKHLESKDSSKKMLIIKHKQVLSKNSFNIYAQESDLFNEYLDIVDYYLNTVNFVNDSLFVFKFFQFYTQLSKMKSNSKPIIPFTSIGGNKDLLEIICQMEEVLNIILQNIHEKIGTGPGWIKKMLMGKANVPPEIMNFAMKLIEEKFLVS